MLTAGRTIPRGNRASRVSPRTAPDKRNAMSASVLFEPFKLGSLKLPNRVVMSPMSR